MAVRGNLDVLGDAKLWWDIVAHDIEPVIEDAKVAAAAATTLPEEPWGDDTWAIWTAAIKSATGAKGRGLFHPLRLALTAREVGSRTEGVAAADGPQARACPA